MMNVIKDELGRRVLKKYALPTAHPEHVADYALTIFHALPKKWWEHDTYQTDDLQLRLHLASLLHDVGYAIGEKGHHKHSRYIIEHCAHLKPFSRDVTENIAMLALSHRKKAKKSWLAKRFDDDLIMLRLAAVLRIADGIDRNHRGLVQIVSVEVCAKKLTITLRGATPKMIEHILLKKADLWPIAFSIPLHIQSEHMVSSLQND